MQDTDQPKPKLIPAPAPLRKRALDLKEGDAILIWPEPHWLCAESFTDLTEWLQSALKRVQRARLNLGELEA